MSIGQVGVRVPSAEVGGWNAVLGGRLRETELFYEDGMGVWTGNAVQPIEQDVETLRMGKEVLDQVKVEDRFEELDIISDGINDLNLQGSISSFSNLREVDLNTGAQLRYCHGYG